VERKIRRSILDGSQATQQTKVVGHIAEKAATEENALFSLRALKLAVKEAKGRLGKFRDPGDGRVVKGTQGRMGGIRRPGKRSIKARTVVRLVHRRRLRPVLKVGGLVLSLWPPAA